MFVLFFGRNVRKRIEYLVLILNLLKVRKKEKILIYGVLKLLKNHIYRLELKKENLNNLSNNILKKKSAVKNIHHFSHKA